jgi:hypothetical protein
LGRERTGLIDVSTAEAAASETTEAPTATATAPRLIRAGRSRFDAPAVRCEIEEDWAKGAGDD